MAFHIVGIGASAGGLNSLQCFLAAIREEFGFAVVFMQHLSPKHKSLLPELLRAKRSDLRIEEITDGLEVLPGKIYLCPAGEEVRIGKATFHVAAPSKDHVHLPIDEFFISLAEEVRERAIAVIFSGAGTDGARGIQAIRDMGGTVFVQDPATAEFASMPLAAINTGQADGVFKPDEIAREILKLQAPNDITAGPDNGISPEDFETFCRLIYEKTGHRFNHYKKSVVGRRIRRRMYLRGVSSARDFIDLTSKNDSEAALLAADLMIGVTSFFRDRPAWKALKLGLIKKLASASDDSPIRVWTPACATGEEAYSIAMMIREELAIAGRKREIQTFATDVSESSLDRAREGKYPDSITADVPPDYMRKYFTSAEDGISVIVNKEIRECVVFAKQDILTDPPFSRLDLIICRNLLIYLEPDAQEKCITLFHYALKDGGHLFLGDAESVGRKSAFFKSLGHKKCRIYQKIETMPSSRLPLAVPFAAERTASPRTKPVSDAECGKTITGLVQDALLEEYAPAAVAINQHYDILYHNGPTNNYLRQPRGTPTQNLLELLPENLHNRIKTRIRGGLYRAIHEAKTVSIRTSMLGEDGRKRTVLIRMSRLKEDLFLVVFRPIPEEKTSPADKACDLSSGAPVFDDTAIHQLESELSSTRADLQNNIEQLKSLNEELQSSNEELQAANEELETSREELQSLNEELIAVNAQLQSKVEEQEETNNDLNNFLASTNIPTIFLDQRFRVKRFTPAMSRLVQLILSDIGRPISDMSQENLGPDLIADAKAVLDQLVPVRKELLINQTWFVRAALPYRTSDNRIEGVVITYTDVTDLKKTEERTRHLASFPQLNPNPVIEADVSGKVTFSNPATQKVLGNLGMDKGEVSAFLPEDLDALIRDWDRKEESTTYRDIVIKDRIFGESIYFSPKFGIVRIYAFDITERKRTEALTGHLAALVESADEAIISEDLNGVIQTWNIGAEKIFGYTAAEAVGRNISFLVPHGYMDEAPWIIERILKGEHIEHFESERMRKDGTIVGVSLTYSAIKDSNGKITGISKIAHDITERKIYEQQLARQASLLDLSYDAICVRDTQDRITYWNDSAARMYGYTREEGLGRVSHELLRTEFPEPLKSIEEEVRREGHWTGELLHTRRDGVRINVISRWVMSRDEHGNSLLLETNTDITERKRAEDEARKLTVAVQQGKDKLSALISSITDEVWFADIRKKFTLANPSALRSFDFDAIDEVDIEKFVAGLEVLRPDGSPRPVEEAPPLRALRGEVVVNQEEIIRIPGKGELHHREVNAAPVRDAKGNIIGSVSVVRDITERKLAEEKLRESEEQFRALADSIPNLAWWANGDGYITWYNKRWYEYTGTTPGQMEGWGWQSVHDPEVLPKVLEQWKVSLRTGKPFDMVFPLRGADSVFRSFLTRVMPVFNQEGKVVRWFGTNTDISEQRKIEEVLLAHRELMETVINSLPLHVCLIRGSDLRLQLINPAYQALAPGKEMMGKTLDEVWPESGRDFAALCRRVLETGEPYHVVDERNTISRQPDGPIEERYFSWSLYRVRLPGEEGWAILNPGWETTARKQAENDLLELSEDMAARNVELEEVNKELESFIYSISHDLRAPLRHIGDFAKILSEDYLEKLDDQGRDYLKRIRKGSEKMSRLIEDLLNLSRISRQQINRKKIDVSRLVRSVVSDLCDSDPGRHVEVKIAEGLSAFADPRLVEIALSNLLGNAWKFTSKTENAKIEFGAIDQEGKTVYYVKDNGAGFDPSFSDKMFWPFHRLHTEKEFPGTGIGLTIVERIIHRHSGRVWAQGEPGKGATIFFAME